jgi:hypothetical protein
MFEAGPQGGDGGDEIKPRQSSLKGHLRGIRRSYWAALEKRSLLFSYLDDRERHVIEGLFREKGTHMAKLKRLEMSTNSRTMADVLTYVDVLRHELAHAHKNIAGAHDTDYQLKDASKILRDVKLFANDLRLWSHGQVRLQLLSRESEAFLRCKKAVKDNASKSILDDAKFGDIKVVNVFKLEHEILSSRLRRAVDNANAGQIKGLFAIVPNDFFHELCACGLPVPQLETPKISAVGAPGDREGWLHRAWFARSGDTEASGADWDTILAPSHRPKNEAIDFLHFTKHSITQCEKLTYAHKQSGGFFIALCRVLIDKCRNISGPISNQDLIDAVMHGEDAVYTTST